MKSENKLTQAVDDIIKENRRQLEDIKHMRKIYSNDYKPPSLPSAQIIIQNSNNEQNNITHLTENKDQFVGEGQSVDFEAKLRRKKLKIRNLKENNAKLLVEINNLKKKITENERFRENLLENLDNFEAEVKNNELVYQEKEALLINNYKELENEFKAFAEKASERETILLQKYQELDFEKNNLEEQYEIKDNEAKVLHQKLQLMEEYLKGKYDTGEKQKPSLRSSSNERVANLEKMFEILVYFLKKVGDQDSDLITVESLNVNLLQQKLIEIENSITQFQNISPTEQRINGNVDESNLQILTRKIKQVNLENDTLKGQLNELLRQQTSNQKQTNRIPTSNWEDKYKKLEKRLVEIEKELAITRTNNSVSSVTNNEGGYQGVTKKR